MSASLAQLITRAMGGNWHGSYGTIPAPGHSLKDRSVSIRPHSSDPNDVIVHSFAGEDPLVIKEDLRRQGMLPKRFGRAKVHSPWNPTQMTLKAAESNEVQKRLNLARWLWQRAQPIDGTLAERYLRSEARNITVPLPATLRFLPASGKHPPSMIAAFGLPNEPEPGVLRIDTLSGVHLTKLRADGLNKADVQPNKIMLGRGHSFPIVVAPVNDIGGLAIAEGIEDALSVFEALGVGAWAAGSASRLPALADHVPAYVDYVTVIIDPDPAGELFGNALIERLEYRGIEVCGVPVRNFRAAALRLREAGHGQ